MEAVTKLQTVTSSRDELKLTSLLGNVHGNKDLIEATIHIESVIKNVMALKYTVFNHNVEKGFWKINSGLGLPFRTTSEAVALIISEFSEALEALRKERFFTYFEFYKSHNDLDVLFEEDKEGFKFQVESNQKDTFEDEIIDVIIRCLDMLGSYPMSPSNDSIQDFPLNSFIDLPYPKLMLDMTNALASSDDYNLKNVLEAVVKALIIWLIVNRSRKSENGYLVIPVYAMITGKLLYNKLRASKHGKSF